MPNDSTKQFIEIDEIRDGIIILRNGSLRSIIEVTSINFDLRSEDEQIAITRNFQGFLNSIDFPVQISIVSRPYDIDSYVALVGDVIEKSQNDLLKVQAIEYQRFIKELSEISNIVSKKFYVVVPFEPVSIPTKEGIMSSVTGIFKSKKSEAKISDEDFEKYSIQLLQRAELVYDGIVASGLKGNLLREDSLKNLFYQIYNPSQFS